jgi:Cdc6-like AAA superfamily ATPase
MYLRTFNLASLIQAKIRLDATKFTCYLEHLKIKFKDGELDCIEKLYSHVSSIADLGNFFMGYVIPQIGKEFDLLRFGKNNIVNIELKRESSLEKIAEQLEKNRYYLSFLNKDIHTFTYVASTDELYQLDNSGQLSIVDFNTLILLLKQQETVEAINLDIIFNPSNYLVSPFNSTKAFIENRYFLTENQKQHKNDILKSFESSEPVLVAITGEPGTGKTLLTYDIAKHYLSNKKVAVIHCANLNPGQRELNTIPGWNIIPIKFVESHILLDSSYEVIIIDEAQRIYPNQLESIYQYVKANNIKCIFSYDAKQCFSDYEYRRKIPKKIEDDFKAKKYQLKKTIRSNKEIVTFVSNLFNPRQSNPEQTYNNIDVQFFYDSTDVLDLTGALKRKGWQVVNYTPSSIFSVSYDKYQDSRNPNAHGIIGQEFDKVVAVIDHSFYFDSFGNLCSNRVHGAPNYDLDKMLYQIMTRAREKLSVIILNNPDVLVKCLRILNK